MLQRTTEELGWRLGMLRYRTTLSQKDVAVFCSVSPVTVRNWESGKYKPTLPNLKKVAELYFHANAFEPGNERAEVLILWESVGPDVIFDENWWSSMFSPSVAKPTLVVDAGQVSLPHNKPVEEVSGNPYATWSLFQLDIAMCQRLRMIEYVNSIWIRGYLERMTAKSGSIQMQLSAMPKVVSHPLGHLQYEGENGCGYHIVSSIIEMYNNANGKLLILGESDLARTMALLLLTRHLLGYAQLNVFYPIPVIFDLSSWSEKCLSITTWLVDELSLKYQIPRSLGQTWLTEKQILPLLDKLDGVALEQRAACIVAINEFLQEHGLVPTVICSREAYYLTQKQHLLLHNAVAVQMPATA